MNINVHVISALVNISSIDINIRHTGSNLRGHIPPKAKIIHNTKLLTQKPKLNKTQNTNGQL